MSYWGSKYYLNEYEKETKKKKPIGCGAANSLSEALRQARNCIAKGGNIDNLFIEKYDADGYLDDVYIVKDELAKVIA